jgi:hypothetical protein
MFKNYPRDGLGLAKLLGLQNSLISKKIPIIRTLALKYQPDKNKKS